VIDLQLNYPILPGQQELFADLLRDAIAAEPRQVMELPPYGGNDEHRRTAADWLSRDGHVVEKERVMLCTGGHHAVFVSLLALGLRGHGIAVDPLTYGNFKIQAASLGIELWPCAGDELGMKASALAHAVEARGLRAVYLMPTVHNPMGTVMPETRRQEICEVARKHDLLILDDDAYGFLEGNAPPSFAVLAPDRSFSVWSFTKPFAPAMKLAFLSFPEQYADQLTTMIHVTSSGAPAIFAEIATRLIRSGALTGLLAAKRDEAARTQKLARAILEGLHVQSHPTSYHLWIDLPENKPAKVVADHLKADGVLVSPSDVYRATASVKTNGLRIALGNVRQLSTLQEGLQRVRDRIQALAVAS